MKRTGILVLVVAVLLGVLALSFVDPRRMLSPGPLVKAHAHLASDCFACHAPFRGADPARCVACHALPDIGLRTTQGMAIPARAGSPGLRKTAFHQQLITQDCMACHSDHAGPALERRSRVAFSHELLRAPVRERCETCHAAPDNPLHRQIDAGCARCHQVKAWTPASFDHKRFFQLDRDHDTRCLTCHTGGDFSRYTCYGCHEHRPDKIRREHQEEGIKDFENCVACHRSAHGEPRRPDGRKGEARRQE